MAAGFVDEFRLVYVNLREIRCGVTNVRDCRFNEFARDDFLLIGFYADYDDNFMYDLDYVSDDLRDDGLILGNYEVLADDGFLDDGSDIVRATVIESELYYLVSHPVRVLIGLPGLIDDESDLYYDSALVGGHR